MAVTWTYEAPAEGATNVEVVFNDGTLNIKRGVNAVFVDGVYNPSETEERVKRVGNGVEKKFALGVFLPAGE